MYLGFNDHHLTEKLAEQEKLAISREKVRQILRGAGIASPRKRRGNKHRSRRERKAAEGMMLQVDGSPPRLVGRQRTVFVPDRGPSMTLRARWWEPCLSKQRVL